MNHITGRIKSHPDNIINDNILKPQFNYELDNLLVYYIAIEKVLAIESVKLNIITEDEALCIIKSLNKIRKKDIEADPSENMSDISFAIEKHVEKDIKEVIIGWHIDRSRNDVQSCANTMFARDRVINISTKLNELCESLIDIGNNSLDVPFPGYTHFQPAQIITPGFYFSSIVEELLQSNEAFLNYFDRLNQCPLGGGAMAGLEYGWDRETISTKLGFLKPKKMALNTVASRQWLLEFAALCSNLGVFISRVVTDLINWCVSGYIELPDSLSGISSSMPQKKNYPILERIRGKTAHLISFHNDFNLAQKNTPYTNLVEVSKEGSKYLKELFINCELVLDLFTLVIENIKFNTAVMKKDCENDFFGGFSLANYLTKYKQIPSRKAQAISGKIINGAIDEQMTPLTLDSHIITKECLKYGYKVSISNEKFQEIFSIKYNLNKKTMGSTNPLSVEEVLKNSNFTLEKLKKEWVNRSQTINFSIDHKGG